MKIEEVFQSSCGEGGLPKTQKKVLAFFKKFPGEVFPYAIYWDERLVNEVNLKPSTIDWCIWALQRAYFLDKEKWDNRTYFGFPEAISRFREEKHKKGKRKVPDREIGR